MSLFGTFSLVPPETTASAAVTPSHAVTTTDIQCVFLEVKISIYASAR